MEYGELFIIYYSGRIPDVPANPAKVRDFVYGDEEKKKVLLKQFMKDVILPIEQKNLQTFTDSKEITKDKVDELQNYVK